MRHHKILQYYEASWNNAPLCPTYEYTLTPGNIHFLMKIGLCLVLTSHLNPDTEVKTINEPPHLILTSGNLKGYIT